MLDLEYRHVDVFSRRAAAKTAFLTEVDLSGRSGRLRIFTEDEELDFAGGER